MNDENGRRHRRLLIVELQAMLECVCSGGSLMSDTVEGIRRLQTTKPTVRPLIL